MAFQLLSLMLAGIAGMFWFVGRRVVPPGQSRQPTPSSQRARFTGLFVLAIPVFLVLFLPRGLYHREWALGTMTALLGFWAGSKPAHWPDATR